MPYVVVVGSANYDLTVRLERLPAPGETITGGEIYASFGGKGANQAVAARRAGAEVSFIARVGQDEHGEAIVQNLARCGLDTDGIVRDNDHPSGTALIMVDRMGRNMIAVAPGSNAYLTADNLHGMERRIAQARTVLVQLEIPIETVAPPWKWLKHTVCAPSWTLHQPSHCRMRSCGWSTSSPRTR